MWMTQEKIVQSVEAKFGCDITNELQNQMPVVILTPTYSSNVMARHNARVITVHAQKNNMLAANETKNANIEQEIMTHPNNTNLVIELTKFENDIIQLQFEMQEEVEVYLSEKEKNDFHLDTKYQQSQEDKNLGSRVKTKISKIELTFSKYTQVRSVNED